jgi:CheY-like chemotaxis protein
MASLKLLVVEDDAPGLELMAEVFTSLQAEVRPVDNSETAAALVDREKVDGIFLDLEMPRLHGFDLTHRIRESSWNKSTPIIVVSGRSDRQTMRESFSVGASYFLQKPVDREKLSRLLRTVRGGMLQNRRRSARVSLHTELMCGIGMRTIRGMSWNLSQTGMQVEVFGLEPGNVVQLSFRLPPSRENIDATGVVAWVGENRQGIQFKKMSAHNQELIRNFIGELEH